MGAESNALRHGHASDGKESPTYRSWKAMKRRCDDEKFKQYENYGGRGITYDPRWVNFDYFFTDMGERPSGTSLDRIDRNGNYSQCNCRWATRTQQNRNTSRSVINGDIALLIYRDAIGGEKHQVIADRYGCSAQTVSNIKTGHTWSDVTGAIK